MDERRAAYEAIAYGEDPRITPADRMRALDKLEDIGALDEVDAVAVAEVRRFAGLPDDELNQELAPSSAVRRG